jgi:hypothetical protein
MVTKIQYSVSNGIRIVELQLKQHMPSHMLIAGQRVLITYEGQPITCYGRNETAHQYGECPHRRTSPSLQQPPHTDSWTQILVNGPRTKRQNEEKRKSREERGGPLNTNKNTDTKKYQEMDKNRVDRYRRNLQYKRPTKTLTTLGLLQMQTYPQKP